MQGCLPRINMQLKAWGIVVPGSSFHHMSRVAYTPKYEGWVEVQQLLLEMRNFCIANDTKLAIYVLPQFTSLRRDLLTMPRQVLGEYLDTIQVPHGFGFEHFKGRSWEELAVSPFDYHPNVKANGEIADLIYDWLHENVGFGAVLP